MSRGGKELTLTTALVWFGQQLEIDGIGHHFIAAVVRMEMIAGVEIGLDVTWPLWISRDRVKIDHAVKFLAFTDPPVDRLTRLLFLWIVLSLDCNSNRAPDSRP
jgi:hypothetical protein